MNWRNCVAVQVARTEDVYVIKVSDEFACQQRDHNKQHPECLSGRLAIIFLPAGSGVTGSHATSPLCWVSGRRMLCGECEGEHTIQPLLPHQEHHGSSLTFRGLTGLPVWTPWENLLLLWGRKGAQVCHGLCHCLRCWCCSLQHSTWKRCLISSWFGSNLFSLCLTRAPAPQDVNSNFRNLPLKQLRYKTSGHFFYRWSLSF